MNYYTFFSKKSTNWDETSLIDKDIIVNNEPEVAHIYFQWLFYKHSKYQINERFTFKTVTESSLLKIINTLVRWKEQCKLERLDKTA